MNKETVRESLIKVIFITLFLLFAYAGVAMADDRTYTRSGNTFEQVSTRTSSVATQTPYKWKDTKGNEYPIYITKTGRCFVIKTSQKTGKEYKQYLKEEVSREVAKEMNITYIEKQTTNK